MSSNGAGIFFVIAFLIILIFMFCFYRLIYMVLNFSNYKYNLLLFLIIEISNNLLIYYLRYHGNKSTAEYSYLIFAYSTFIIPILIIVLSYFPFSNANVLKNNASKGTSNALKSNNANK